MSYPGLASYCFLALSYYPFMYMFLFRVYSSLVHFCSTLHFMSPGCFQIGRRLPSANHSAASQKLYRCRSTPPHLHINGGVVNEFTRGQICFKSAHLLSLTTPRRIIRLVGRFQMYQYHVRVSRDTTARYDVLCNTSLVQY